MAYSVPVFVVPAKPKEPSGSLVRVSKVLIAYLDSDYVLDKTELNSDWIKRTIESIYDTPEGTVSSIETILSPDQQYISHVEINLTHKE